MILDEGCAERGCPMHDSRETKGVVFMRKEWVGLTGQEKAWIASVSLDVHDAVHRTDAKLKEKNT